MTRLFAAMGTCVVLAAPATASATVTFGSPGTPVNAGTGTSQVKTADVNGDGHDDILTMDRGGAAGVLNVIRGTGTGALGAGFAYSQVNAGSNQWLFDAGNLNGDGKADVVEAESSGNALDVFLSNNGSFGSTASQGLTVTSPGAPLLGDFNGDGRDDIAVSGPTVRVFLNSGSGTFPTSPGQTLSFPANTSGVNDMVTADLNGDGLDDIIAGYSDSGDGDREKMAVWLAQPGGTFPSSPSQTGASTGISVTATDTRLFSGDVTGDGAPEVIWVAGETGFGAHMSIFTNDGAGHLTSTPQTIVPSGVASLRAQIGIGDFNGDGINDIVWFVGNQPGTLLYESQGDHMATPGQLITTGAFTADGGTALDLNEDGAADLVALDSSNPQKTYPILNLSGPPIYSAPASLDFGSAALDTLGPPQTLAFTNSGPSFLKISSATPSGDFLKTGDSCTGQSVPHNASCTITLRFAPSATGGRNGTLTLTDNTAGGTHAVALTGNGTPLPNAADGATGQAGAPGAIGATGPVGPPGAVGPRGRDAKVTCTPGKPKHGKVKVTCVVKFAASSSALRAHLSRDGFVVAHAIAQHGVLRFRFVRRPAAGNYVLTTLERRHGRLVRSRASVALG